MLIARDPRCDFLEEDVLCSYNFSNNCTHSTQQHASWNTLENRSREEWMKSGKSCAFVEITTTTIRDKRPRVDENDEIEAVSAETKVNYNTLEKSGDASDDPRIFTKRSNDRATNPRKRIWLSYRSNSHSHDRTATSVLSGRWRDLNGTHGHTRTHTLRDVVTKRNVEPNVEPNRPWRRTEQRVKCEIHHGHPGSLGFVSLSARLVNSSAFLRFG